MPTHLFHYRVPSYDDGSHIFHMNAGIAYRLRNALLAAGAIDPEDAVPGDRVHFLELYEENEVRHHVQPADILATVRLWRKRIAGVQVNPPRGLTEEERTQLVSTMRRPDSTDVIAVALPRIDAEELVESFVTWAERAARKAGGFIVAP